MLLLDQSGVAGDAEIFETLAKCMLVIFEFLLLRDLKLVVVAPSLVVVNANAVEKLSFELIQGKSVRLVLHARQEEVHAVLDGDLVMRALDEVDRFHTLRLSVVVIDLLQIVLIDEVVLNKLVDRNILFIGSGGCPGFPRLFRLFQRLSLLRVLLDLLHLWLGCPLHNVIDHVASSAG